MAPIDNTKAFGEEIRNSITNVALAEATEALSRLNVFLVYKKKLKLNLLISWAREYYEPEQMLSKAGL